MAPHIQSAVQSISSISILATDGVTDAMSVLVPMLTFVGGIAVAVIVESMRGHFASRDRAAAEAHQVAMWEKERAHESQRRLQEEHAAARRKYLDQVADAKLWIDYRWGDTHGLDVDWVPVNQPPPTMREPADVIAALQEVALKHPTARVRDLAASLAQSISGNYGDVAPRWDPRTNQPTQAVGVDPGGDTFRKWSESAGELLAAMHNSPIQAGT
jgi:hypothetical protein